MREQNGLGDLEGRGQHLNTGRGQHKIKGVTLVRPLLAGCLDETLKDNKYIEIEQKSVILWKINSFIFHSNIYSVLTSFIEFRLGVFLDSC